MQWFWYGIKAQSGVPMSPEGNVYCGDNAATDLSRYVYHGCAERKLIRFLLFLRIHAVIFALWHKRQVRALFAAASYG